MDAVFSAPEFNRGRPWSIVGLLMRYFDFSLDPATRRVLAIAVTIAVGLALARYAYRELLERRHGSAGHGAGEPGRRGRDPWLAAQELARGGDFTMAAHALYLALLETLAGRHGVRLHPSKTVGDYLHDLGGRSSPLVPTVRDFARSYELVAYGLRACDAERYGHLHALASRVVRPNG